MFTSAIVWVKGLTVIKQVMLGTAVLGTAGYVAVTPTESTPPEGVKSPITEIETKSETTPVAFQKETVEDGNLAKGKTELRRAGVDGVKTATFSVTMTDGVEVKRELVKEEVTTAPVSEVTAIGSYVAPTPTCDPNYAGACVPIASDVDCGGGSGNGPAYVYGTVQVIGTDIYGLDRNNDGYGCE